MKIALLTVCTDAYPMEYARKVITQFQRLSRFEVVPYCVTDRPAEIGDLAKTIQPPFGRNRGWWNKLVAYRNSIQERFIVYLDIDTVLVKNFDEEIETSIDKLKNGYDVACVSDAIGWKNNKYSSSMMVLDNHNKSMDDIFEEFCRTLPFDYDGGDQVFTGHVIQKYKKKVYYIDETYKNLKLNLKFHLGQKILGQWKFPSYIPFECKIVDCGGKPKPHELGQLKYIKENWHDVE
jgi:hypothetical protein